MIHSNFKIPSRRMMVYCHDSVGLGHLRRSMAICTNLSAQFHGSSFLIVTGTPYVPLFSLPRGVDYVKLPALTKQADGVYKSKFLSLRTRQLVKCRRALLLATVQYFRPSVFLVDKTPVGVCREVIPVLKWLQRNCPETTVVFGMRDIEDTPEATLQNWEADDVFETLDECFNEIWVYGSASVYDVVREYDLPVKVQDKLRYVGYLKRDRCAHSAPVKHEGMRVLVTVGGGSDGYDLLRTYCADAARAVSDCGGHSTIVGGPDLAPRFAHELRESMSGRERVRWLDHTCCMSCLMHDADLVVSMGGYNTMCEIASFGTPALVVPRVTPRYEQAIRAARWDQLGVVRAAHPRTLTPERLSEHVLDSLIRPRTPDVSKLDLHGMDRIVERCSNWWNGGGCREPALHV